MKKNGGFVKYDEYTKHSNCLMVDKNVGLYYNDIGELIAFDKGSKEEIIISNITAYGVLNNSKLNNALMKILGEVYIILLSDESCLEMESNITYQDLNDFAMSRVSGITLLHDYYETYAELKKSNRIYLLRDLFIEFTLLENKEFVTTLKSSDFEIKAICDFNGISTKLENENFDIVMMMIRQCLLYEYIKKYDLNSIVEHQEILSFFNDKKLAKNDVNIELLNFEVCNELRNMMI